MLLSSDIQDKILALRQEIYSGTNRFTPASWELRHILADLFGEVGEEVLEYGQRYQADNHLRPYLTYVTYDSVQFRGGDMWHWYKKSWWSYCDPSSNIPDVVFVRLKGGIAGSSYRVYDSPKEADDDLAQALESLKP